MRIYTRTGDAGQTGLFGGQRVSKDDLRVEAYGTVDELNSALGIAASLAGASELGGAIARVQSDLFSLGADLATPFDAGETHGKVTVERIGAERAAALESEIDRLDSSLPPLNQFILPGGAPLAARLHFARAVCRRAERRAVALSWAEPINPEVLRYLNRLSDLLFVMTRAANQLADVPDVPWQP